MAESTQAPKHQTSNYAKDNQQDQRPLDPRGLPYPDLAGRKWCLSNPRTQNLLPWRSHAPRKVIQKDNRINLMSSQKLRR